MSTPSEADQKGKRKAEEAKETDVSPSSPSAQPSDPKKQQVSTAIVSSAPSASKASDVMAIDAPPKKPFELLKGTITRQTADFNAATLNLLVNRHEIGTWRVTSKKVLKNTCIDIDAKEIRRCMTDMLSTALTALYLNNGSMRTSELVTEIADVVPATVDVCMTALYAKLRNVNRFYSAKPTRYTEHPQFTKEIELPLPLALLVESFGAFETQSLVTNTIYVPTYAEDTQYAGRSSVTYPIVKYLSYTPTFKELQVPMKTIDPQIKTGTAWWTYKVKTVHAAHDLVATLPPTLYTDFSAQLRTLLLVPDPEKNNEVQEIVTHPTSVVTYGYRAKALRTGIAVRTFLALCHCPEEFWKFD
uniref:Putative CP n=1 Tax=Alloteropsis cryptic virus 2 TaxID=2809262 RepID=A0A890CAV8_9VIRU|nr:putative CP [Alloteropsis cryptic virus 2]